MRREMSPLAFILIGFVLVVSGLVLPFLMVFNVIEASFGLSFLSYGMSITGTFLGLAGAAQYIIRHRGNREQ